MLPMLGRGIIHIRVFDRMAQPRGRTALLVPPASATPPDTGLGRARVHGTAHAAVGPAAPAREELARVVELDAAVGEAAGKDDEEEAAEQEDGLDNSHALLEDDLVGEGAEAGADGQELALRLVALRLEGDDGALPDLVVLDAQVAQLREDRLVEGVEKEVDFGDLASLQLGQGLLQELRLRLDVLQRQGRVGLERLQALGQLLEEGVLHGRARGRRGAGRRGDPVARRGGRTACGGFRILGGLGRRRLDRTGAGCLALGCGHARLSDGSRHRVFG